MSVGEQWQLLQKIHWLSPMLHTTHSPLLLVETFSCIFLISIFISSCLWMFLPLKYKRPAWAIILSFSLFGTLIPLFGWLALAVISLSLHLLYRAELTKEIHGVRAPEILAPVNFNRPAYSQETMQAYLHLKNIPLQQRIEALIALTAAPSPRSNLLLRNMLHNNNDELRLLAFALLDGQEDKINTQINLNQKQLKSNKNTHDTAQAHKRLAFLYWELAYLKLTQGDLLSYIVEQSLYHLHQALKLMPDDASLLTLLARIQVQQNNSAAEASFEKAKIAGAISSKVLPYLAEIQFKSKDYAAIRQLFSEAPDLKDIPNLRSVVRFWSKTPVEII